MAGRWEVPFATRDEERDVERMLATPPFASIDRDRFGPPLTLEALLAGDARLVRFGRGEVVVRAGEYGHSAFLVRSGRVRLDVAGVATCLVADGPAFAGPTGDASILPGEWFGLLSALGRTPRTATAIATGDPTELVEMRWQGLRDLLACAPEVRAHVEAVYRRHRLERHLATTPIFAGLEGPELARLAAATRYESYGRFDWYGGHRRLDDEPVVLAEGTPPPGLILVAAGHVRVSERYHDRERTRGYLGRGGSYGLDELRSGRPAPSRHTLRAMGYADVLVVPWPLVVSRLIPETPTTSAAAPDLLEFLADGRYLNGTAAMAIDLERCVRCDDCVRACAGTHGGVSRFERRGSRVGRFQIASACLHCRDPVCLIGCPTGAIHRDLAGGQVVVQEPTCIGCGTCAASCPYGAIRMRETGPTDRVATKCDLCVGLAGEPACQAACAHGALVRVDPAELEELAPWSA